MRKSKSKDLPEEIIEEILWRLPIKTIVRCTSVCRSWYSLIKNPNFISTHLYRALFSRNNPLFLRPATTDTNPKYKLYFDNKDFGEYMSLNPPFDSKDFFAVVGSCNGLVCLFGGDSVFSKYRFFLWNPSIRKYLLLPLHQSISWRHSWENYVIGFGFDSKTHDYKVLSMRGTFVDNGNHFSAELYSLNANSWKNISNVAPKFDGWISHKSYSCSVNDAFHWLAYKMKSITETECVIMVFDLRDEVLREMKLPQCLANSSNLNLNLKVYVCGESSIAVIHQEDEKNSSIWVMKEYGVVESWVKLGTVGKRWRGKSRVLGFRCNGDALLHFNRGPGVIASQNIESKRVKNFISTVRYSDSSVYSYMESLALLDKGADVSANGTSTPK